MSRDQQRTCRSPRSRLFCRRTSPYSAHHSQLYLDTKDNKVVQLKTYITRIVTAKPCLSTCTCDVITQDLMYMQRNRGYMQYFFCFHTSRLHVHR